jgi:hypothetical protein
VEGIRAIGQELRQGNLRREVDQVVPGWQARRTFDRGESCMMVRRGLVQEIQ